jgi:outer membrane protein W
MKKISALIFVLTLMLSTVAFAADVAIKQGTVEFGIGNLISYSNVSNDDANYNLFSIGTFGNGLMNPMWIAYAPVPTLNFDYFIMDNLGIGLLGGYSSVKEEDWENSYGTWFIGPEIKYYIGIMDKVQVDAHFSIVYIAMNVDDNSTLDPDDQVDLEQSKLTLGLALNYFLTNNFAVNIGLDYTRFFNQKLDGEKADDTAMNGVTINLGFKAFLGLGG